ncbi:MAG: hypothetical protein ACE5Q4_03920, partial [Nitrosopumilus sp.]
MGIQCKNKCESGQYKAMKNISVSIAYFIANRCTNCSDTKNHYWYLKWVNRCPCCGSTLRRKPKKSPSRERFIS